MVKIDLGTLAPPLGEQIDGLSEKDAELLEGHRQAINRLSVHGLISRSVAHRARVRLVDMIRDTLVEGGDDEG